MNIIRLCKGRQALIVGCGPQIIHIVRFCILLHVGAESNRIPEILRFAAGRNLAGEYTSISTT